MNAEIELEALKFIEGPLYTQHRDSFLAETPGVRALLLQKADDKDWRTQVTAKILLAWLDHRREGDELLAAIDRENWARWRRTAAGAEGIFESYASLCAEHPEKQAYLLPFSWEAVLKRRHEWSDDKRRVFVQMMQQVPNELTVEVLFFSLRALAETESDRALAVFGLRLMPRELVRPRLARLRREQAEILRLFRETFDEPFVEGR
jgi:hypothetical protein